MTPECKRIKICCLTSLAVGLAEIVAGFLMQPPFGVSIFSVFPAFAAGLVSLVLGVHGSRAANVPSKAAALAPFAFVMCALAGACAGVSTYFAGGFTYITAVVAAPAVLALLVAVFSRQVKAALDRA